MALLLRPISFRKACAFVAAFHRHNKPPRGHKFSIAVENDGDLVGVVMVGRPVSRVFDDGWQAEVNRVCTDPARPLAVRSDRSGHCDGANSMLYGAAVRACKAMGYRRVITYTQADESGKSLRGAGFVRVREIAARKSWAESSTGSLQDMRDPVGNGGVARILWEICFGPVKQGE